MKKIRIAFELHATILIDNDTNNDGLKTKLERDILRANAMQENPTYHVVSCQLLIPNSKVK